MHKLERPEAPGCLASYQQGNQEWRRISPLEKGEIWVQLDAMQSERCAYCENRLRTDRRHIEHFRQRSDFPRRTFQWENLFGSCNHSNSCGRHKDRTAHDANDLIKPDEDDPDVYLRFLSDGSIIPKSDLSGDERHRAEETLRVFNLDHEQGVLRWMRYSAVRGYLGMADELAQCLAIDEEFFVEFLREELESVAGEPFETAIRHVLSKA